MKLIHQEIKKSRFHFEKSIYKLRNFSVLEISCFFITLNKVFTMMQDDSRETFNMKVVDIHEIYNFDTHNFFQKYLDLKLQFYEHRVMKLNT